jgi:hypothetical protein
MKYWKLTDGEKYLCGVIDEGILMMDSPEQNDLVVINDKVLKELSGDSFIDELTLEEVFFDDLTKVEML